MPSQATNPSSGMSSVCPFPTGGDAPGALGLPALVTHIIERYHETHRRELPYAVGLARRVERLYGADPNCPMGLADHLSRMASDLEAHQQREEQILFPMLLQSTPPELEFARRRMTVDHGDVEGQLRTLRQLTRGYTPPYDAPNSWRALHQVCRKIEVDLREHTRLENEVLFARPPR